MSILLFESDKTLLSYRGFIVCFFFVYTSLLIFNPVADNLFKSAFNKIHNYAIPFFAFFMMTQLSLPYIFSVLQVPTTGRAILLMSILLAAFIYLLHFINPLYYYGNTKYAHEKQVEDLYNEHLTHYQASTQFQEMHLGKLPPNRGGVMASPETEQTLFRNIDGHMVDIC